MRVFFQFANNYTNNFLYDIYSVRQGNCSISTCKIINDCTEAETENICLNHCANGAYGICQNGDSKCTCMYV